jgi:hypothetical protein
MDEINGLLAAYFGLSNVQQDGADLRKIERLAAAIDSANYLNDAMAGAARYSNALELLRACLAVKRDPEGLVLEFGVYAGRTINHIANLTGGPVYGFDSFEGLPEDWRPDIRKAAFKLDKLPAVAGSVEPVVGWFEDTLPGFLKAHPGPVGFLHVDCDLYSSTKTIFHHLRGRIVPGTVIVFDEYFNYVGWRRHEFKAFAEFLAESGLRHHYIGAVPGHQQAGVIIC